jgi:hypothetical protein
VILPVIMLLDNDHSVQVENIPKIVEAIETYTKD